MDLSKLRMSLSKLSRINQMQLIMDIRFRRRNNLTVIKTRQVRTAKSPSTPKAVKNATLAIDNMSPEQAAQLLALLGDIENDQN
jgi:hypothetical protein